jgi:hypothetical protein
VILIIFVALVIAWFDWNQTILIKKELTLDNYSKLFVNLFLIAIVVERFIEVFNSIWRRRGRLERTRAVQNAKTDGERIEAQRKLDVYRSRTQTLAMYAGFAIGILAGFAGVHTLQVVFDAGSISGSQKTVFQAMDILLTAGLIAGGSKGINAITSLLGDYLAASKEEVTARARADSQEKPE